MFVGISYKQINLSSLPDTNSVVDKKSTAWTALQESRRNSKIYEEWGWICLNIVLFSTSNNLTLPFSSPAVNNLPSRRKLPTNHIHHRILPE